MLPPMTETPDDVLQQVVEHQKRAPQIHDVLDASLKTFLLLEPWLAASSEHQKVKELLPRIRNQVVKHCETLDVSLIAAESGWHMADNAITVFGELSSRTASADDIRVNRIDFREIRPNRRVSLQSAKKELEDTRNRVEEEKKEHIRNITQTQTHHHGVSGMVEGIVRKIKGRPKNTSYILVSLPILLPIMAGRIDWDERIKHMRERDHKYYTCEQAINQLEAGITHIQLLEHYIDGLARYWAALDMTMKAISVRLESLQKNPKSRMAFSDLRKKYEGIKKDFFDYMTGIQKVQDYVKAQLK
ncbi:SubName: Full=Uncharacterized protein {ECO:0000313/EMBL:CCA71724.1} [Serendipita indica DSM 11827]|nr:SubName: Full=Uncharacterized protein {ECO:0000313/EMBL:CCA71724.1} [Serendipita indica DSM 11827]